jgi:hypothetical protein
VLQNKSTPLDVLDQWSKSMHALVRYQLADNPRLPLEARKRLACDPERMVREATGLVCKAAGGP